MPTAAVAAMPMRIAPRTRALQQRGHEDEADDRQQHARLAHVAELQRRARREQRARGGDGERARGQASHEAGDDAALVEADEGEEEADAHREAVLQARRDGRGQPGAHAQERDEREEEPAATNTAPSRCCQVMPSAARPKAMNAFSPMYGATAKGRFA